MTDTARLWQVLGDDTRRTILELVATGERSVNDITASVGLSQPAVSQHLKVLREAGLVTQRPDGNRRLYRIELDGLSPLRAYLDRFWDDALQAFAAFANDPAHDQPEDASPPPPPTRRRKDDHR